MRTGNYGYDNGFMNARTMYGGWWSDAGISATYGHYLRVYASNVDSQSNNYRGYGIAIRCTIRVE